MPPRAPLGLEITHVEGLAPGSSRQAAKFAFYPLPPSMLPWAGPLGFNGTGEWHGLIKVNRASS